VRYRLPVIIFILLCLPLWSCRKNIDDPVPLRKERIAQIYIKLHQLSKKYPPPHPLYSDSSSTILNQYNFTKKEYDRYISYFNEKPERWANFYEEVLRQLKIDRSSSSSESQGKNP
jgi:hypothetical protein